LATQDPDRVVRIAADGDLAATFAQTQAVLTERLACWWPVPVQPAL
jgi:hypothetical protein